MKISSIVGLVIVVAAAVTGCDVKIKANKRIKSETQMGSHVVSVNPGTVLTNSSSVGDLYQYTCGDTSIEIRNEELIVNKVSYGELAPGTGVIVDQGVVFVDGKIRNTTQVSREDKPALE